ncbi:uncharacterized protein PITG_08228 [Phytophthora infestans T30-4]|uniref:Uncharacterized protein n=1 Tax=Phytophthora infestans (strain T30-4) TaxID=403677 RepID=D0N9S4_PHYIT|nr:uncharacterized protein PITG_08228 [Phytophthora infestans T30-4]EEY54562.1 conserved hypothetical protein [Phytophthora infestans T30-4]|eukprot:XP_002904384.1 conserved hypothetical protein [Phytophthora infestans T30-4]
MDGIFVHDTTSLRRRSISTAKNGMYDLQRDYVVLMRTGFAITSRGERIGYSIAQSVSHPDLPELKNLDIVRASMSFCVIFWQQSDQIVESFAHTVIDPGGTVFSFFVLQEVAHSILRMGAPMECAQGRNCDGICTKNEDPTVCSYCQKAIGKLFSTQVSRACSVSKKLVMRLSHTKPGMTAHAYVFCIGCFLASRQLSTQGIQREEVVYKRLVRR